MDHRQNAILLEVKNLDVDFVQHKVHTHAVKNVDFVLHRGQCMGIVGESGSGKSVTSLTILNLLQSNSANQTEGSVLYHSATGEVDLLKAPLRKIYDIRGRKISMVFQEPMSALNPVRKCGAQVKEVLDVHNIGIPRERKDKILALFQRVSLPEVKRIYDSYPHELSGGQLQRVNIAMALATNPDIIICDEPTTALDVTVQNQIILLLKDLVREGNIALLFISHDLDVVAALCDSVVVMYQGQIVEKGELPETFKKPVHPYTRALLTCKPTLANRPFFLPTVDEIISNRYRRQERPKMKRESGLPIITVQNLKVHFPGARNSFWGPRNKVMAVDGVDFVLHQGQILGLVGESGSGKSTVANCISGLIAGTSGNVTFKEIDVSPEVLSADHKLRTRIQLVFQDPYSSLNPMMTIGQSIKEPLHFHKMVPKSQLGDRLKELLDQVGLDPLYEHRYPHQLSGGQRQRACIARALSVEPEVLICDESVSALDVSVQAQILNLLDHLRHRLGLSMIFISHDLSVIHYICDHVVVMKNGKIIEQGNADDIMLRPKELYTQQLIDSLPRSIN